MAGYARVAESESVATTNVHTLVSLLPSTTGLAVTMSMEESISLEETNKIRISLGLKPLTDDSAPADDADKEAELNYSKQREREAKEREAK